MSNILTKKTKWDQNLDKNQQWQSNLKKETILRRRKKQKVENTENLSMSVRIKWKPPNKKIETFELWKKKQKWEQTRRHRKDYSEEDNSRMVFFLFYFICQTLVWRQMCVCVPCCLITNWRLCLVGQQFQTAKIRWRHLCYLLIQQEK